jgi:hypothetical protein
MPTPMPAAAPVERPEEPAEDELDTGARVEVDVGDADVESAKVLVLNSCR